MANLFDINIYRGCFSESLTMISSQRENNKALNVNDRLDTSHGPVSGDASVQYAMNNSQSSLDTSIIYNTQKTGYNVKVEVHDLNELELSKASLSLFKSDAFEFKDIYKFSEMFGEYLTIGAVFGGKIYYKTTYEYWWFIKY